MNRILLQISVIVISALFLFLLGCARTAPSRFYMLSSLPLPAAEEQPAAGESCVTLGVGPIELPAYLDRPEIVTRVSRNQLRLADFDKWAEPLAENFKRALAENLAALLCADSIVVFPWRGSERADYQVAVEVIEFDGEVGGRVSLVARWAVHGKGGRSMLLTRRSSHSEPVVGEDYGAMVAAASRAAEAFSREIAKAIKEFVR
jgi:uncharacterized lipoprotein YmbA